MPPGEVWPHHDKGTTIPVELTNVFVSHDVRRQGIATKLVGKCIAYCNRKNWECVLRVTPYGSSHLTVGQLVEFYQKAGFYVYARTETIYMFKAPK
jgi:GNAT superfamily N-acetyltransferase